MIQSSEHDIKPTTKCQKKVFFTSIHWVFFHTYSSHGILSVLDIKALLNVFRCFTVKFTKFLKTHLAVSVAWIYDSCRKIMIDSFAGIFSVFFGTVVLIYIVPIFIKLFCFNEDTVTLQCPLIKNVMEWRQ